MGHTKKLYEEMELNEFLTHFFTHENCDEDYQYELHKERQLEAEKEAYEQHLSDKY